MESIVRATLCSPILRFLLIGGLAALVNLVVRYLLNIFAAFELAVFVAHLIGMAVAYVLMSAFVFGRSGRSRYSEVFRFAVVNVVTLLVTWIVSVALLRMAFPMMQFGWHAEEIAHFIGVLAPAVTSYYGHRYYSFRARVMVKSGV